MVLTDDEIARTTRHAESCDAAWEQWLAKVQRGGGQIALGLSRVAFCDALKVREAEIARLEGEVDHWRKRATFAEQFAEQFIPSTP